MADRGLASHARHDLELVSGCPDCDALAPDFAALTASLASLRGGTEAGHRDFRLTPEDAARLRGGRGLRAWLRPLAGTGFAFARPLGSALTVVAIVGLVTSNMTGGLAGGAAPESADLESSRDHATDQPIAAPNASDAAAYVSGTPKAGPSGDALASPDVNSVPTQPPAGPGLTDGDPGTPNGIFLASLILLPIGLLLLFGRGLVRRLIGPSPEP